MLDLFAGRIPAPFGGSVRPTRTGILQTGVGRRPRARPRASRASARRSASTPHSPTRRAAIARSSSPSASRSTPRMELGAEPDRLGADHGRPPASRIWTPRFGAQSHSRLSVRDGPQRVGRLHARDADGPPDEPLQLRPDERSPADLGRRSLSRRGEDAVAGDPHVLDLHAGSALGPAGGCREIPLLERGRLHVSGRLGGRLGASRSEAARSRASRATRTSAGDSSRAWATSPSATPTDCRCSTTWTPRDTSEASPATTRSLLTTTLVAALESDVDRRLDLERRRAPLGDGAGYDQLVAPRSERPLPGLRELLLLVSLLRQPAPDLSRFARTRTSRPRACGVSRTKYSVDGRLAWAASRGRIDGIFLDDVVQHLRDRREPSTRALGLQRRAR